MVSVRMPAVVGLRPCSRPCRITASSFGPTCGAPGASRSTRAAASSPSADASSSDSAARPSTAARSRTIAAARATVAVAAGHGESACATATAAAFAPAPPGFPDRRNQSPRPPTLLSGVGRADDERAQGEAWSPFYRPDRRSNSDTVVVNQRAHDHTGCFAAPRQSRHPPYRPVGRPRFRARHRSTFPGAYPC